LSIELTSRLGEYGNDGSAGGADCAEAIEISASTTNGRWMIDSFFIGLFDPGTFCLT
jgi:hypothetical protein